MVTLEHVGICARDTVALKNWYCQLYAMKIVYDNQKPQPTFFLQMEDGNMLEIYPMEELEAQRGNKSQGIRHLSFGTDQIEKEYQRLLDFGVEIQEGLKDNGKGVKTVFFRDGEGNLIHLIQRETPLV